MTPSDQELEDRLEQLHITHDARAVDRAIELAPERSRTRQRKRISAAGALVVAALLLASPPGQSLAGAVGELVGIGDQPTRAANGDPPEHVAFPAGDDQAVIGTGQAPNGLAYELIVSAGREDIPLDRPNSVGMCVDLDIPAVDDAVRDYWPIGCISDRYRKAIADGDLSPQVQSAPEELGPETMFTASGWLPLEVQAVEVDYTAPDGSAVGVPVAFGRVEGGVAAMIDSPDELVFYVAFLPPDVLRQDAGGDDARLTRCEAERTLSGIRVRPVDASGEPLGQFEPKSENAIILLARPPEELQGSDRGVEPNEQGCTE